MCSIGACHNLQIILNNSDEVSSHFSTFLMASVKDWKRSVFIPIPNKGNAKECSNNCTIVLISHTAATAAAKSLQLCPTVQPQSWQPTRLPRPWDSPGKNTEVGCHFLLQCMKVKSESEVVQSCPTPSDPMDCSPPGSTVHGIFQGFSRQEYWRGVPLPSPISHASNAQNSPRQASAVCELWTSRCSSWF